MSTKTISLIIPTKDRAKQLSECLESLSVSKILYREDVEVIIVDNNSSSLKTKEVCESYNVKYLFQPKKGISEASNLGIENSLGKYLIFIDDDVIVNSEEWINELVLMTEEYPKVGYVSGNVIALETKNKTQKMWEDKGGLSKGNSRRVFDQKYFNELKIKAIPLRLIAAGANNLILADAIKEVGGYSEKFGVGSEYIPHGESLEICYRILAAGYTAIYNPKAIVFHQHPTQHRALVKKQFFYGLGDTAVHFHIFLKYRDYRSLLEALFVRNFQIIGRLLLRFIGKHPFSIDILGAQIIGNFLGIPLYLYSTLNHRVRNLIS